VTVFNRGPATIGAVQRNHFIPGFLSYSVAVLTAGPRRQVPADAAERFARHDVGGKGHLSAAEVVVVLEELGCAPWHPGVLPRFGRVDPAAACLLRGVQTAAAVGGFGQGATVERGQPSSEQFRPGRSRARPF
jgi:hypothetical protein